jgi:serine protease Do
MKMSQARKIFSSDRAGTCGAHRSRRALVILLCLSVGWMPLISHASDPFLRRTATVRAVEQVGPSVVSIATEHLVESPNPFGGLSGGPRFREYFSDLFENQKPRTTQDLGSGVIISEKGYVLTNEHLITQSSRISISLADGRTFAAEVIGADATNDIAVLKALTDEPLPWTEPGTSSDIMVGEPVIAIGNPFGLSNSVTTGVISAVDRSIRASQNTFHGFLQTDASINPGNSGGPLLNAEGSLIGINTAIYNGAEGIGFAIPIDIARRVVAELIEHGEVLPVTLGIDFQDLDPALREVMALDPTVRGALINRVKPGEPADTAGIRRGDIVTELDGHSIRSAREFFELLEKTTPNQKLHLRFWRDGQYSEVEVEAIEIPENMAEQLTSRLLGLTLEWQRRNFFAVSRVRSNSPAARIGLQPGDILLAISGVLLDDPSALRPAILSLRGRNRALVVVQRGNGRYHLTIPLR